MKKVLGFLFVLSLALISTSLFAKESEEPSNPCGNRLNIQPNVMIIVKQDQFSSVQIIIEELKKLGVQTLPFDADLGIIPAVLETSLIEKVVGIPGVEQVDPVVSLEPAGISGANQGSWEQIAAPHLIKSIRNSAKVNLILTLTDKSPDLFLSHLEDLKKQVPDFEFRYKKHFSEVYLEGPGETVGKILDFAWFAGLVSSIDSPRTTRSLGAIPKEMRSLGTTEIHREEIQFGFREKQRKILVSFSLPSPFYNRLSFMKSGAELAATHSAKHFALSVRTSTRTRVGFETIFDSISLVRVSHQYGLEGSQNLDVYRVEIESKDYGNQSFTLHIRYDFEQGTHSIGQMAKN